MSMSGFGLPSLFGKKIAPSDDSDATEPTVPVTVVLETEEARDALFAWAEAHLPEGECLVEAKELAGRRRAFVTKPVNDDAELVARTVPKLLRGRLLSTVSYYRTRTDELDGCELHYEEGRYSHRYDVRLKPVVRGRAARDIPMIPA